MASGSVPDQVVATLTPAQRRVAAELACDGPTNEELAERLGISVETVKSHMRQIRAATGYTDRTALAVALVRRRVVIRVRIPDGPV